MKAASQNNEVIGARTRQTKRVCRKDTKERGNLENDVNITNMKGQKRSMAENPITTRKRTAMGDITNAIQAHANRMSNARKTVMKPKDKETKAEPTLRKTKSTVTCKETNAKAETRKPNLPMKRSTRLRTSQSTSALPLLSSVKQQNKEKDSCKEEMTVAEQCEDILNITPDDKISEEDIMDTSPIIDDAPPLGVLPFDLDDDPNVVSEYAADIFKNMRKREAKFSVVNYLTREGSPTTGMMRAILVDWLVEVQENFELYHETLYFAVKVVDYYLQHNHTPKEKLQLVGATALLIACKIEESQPPPLDDFKFICDDAYTVKQFMEMEIKIFKALDFDINIPISYRFLRRFSRVNCLRMDVLTLARFILELSLHVTDFVDKPPSIMAASCLCLAMKMKDVGEWNINHSYHCGYEEKELVEIMKRLNQMLIDAPSYKLQTVRTKYSHPIHFEVAKTKTIEPSILEQL